MRALVKSLVLVALAALPARAGDPMPPEEEPPRTSVGLEARLALLRGDATRFNNQAGFGIGVYAHYRWWGRGPLGLWAGLDLFHDRFFQTVQVVVHGIDMTTGQPRDFMYEDSQQLTHTSFVAMQALRGALGRWSMGAAGGAGFSVAHFYRPYDGITPMQDKSSVVPVVRAQGGVAYDAWRDTSLKLQFTYNWMFSDDTVIYGKPFTDVMDVGLGLVYRF
ncbi:MAG TPA: outer membrane beta-barrel protein [Polyangia bacterium]|nr:outer membrane beta-barrel protein [Polyangia bacterium]